jgi:hypothetical protein
MLSFSFYGDGQCVLDIITWDGNGNPHISYHWLLTQFPFCEGNDFLQDNREK